MKTEHNQATAPDGPAQDDDEKVLHKLAIHQRRLKWLTGIAVGFWVLAVLSAAIVLICYTVFLAPKEQQVMADYGMYGRLADRGTGTSTAAKNAQPMEPANHTDKALGVNFTMTYVVTKGVLAVAVSILILSGGTLATLLLVIFNRRVTLRQINYSLTQISRQLEELQGRRTT